MKKLFATVFALILLPFALLAATIDQANVIDGNSYLPAIKVNGTVYATPHRLNADEAEAWVQANLGITAKARMSPGGFTLDAAGNATDIDGPGF